MNIVLVSIYLILTFNPLVFSLPAHVFSQLDEARNDPALKYLDREVQGTAMRLSVFASSGQSKAEKEVFI